MELICSSGRGRGEGLGAAEGRAGPPLWEDDEKGSGHLVLLMAGRAKEVRCQARLASEGALRSFETPGQGHALPESGGS